MRIKLSIAAIILFAFTTKQPETISWIRYQSTRLSTRWVKVAVWCSKQDLGIGIWELVDAASKKIVFFFKQGKAFGAYGPFKQTYRLNFSAFKNQANIICKPAEQNHPNLKLETMFT
jgi:hypothetical protein